jgi:hypothetical protein
LRFEDLPGLYDGRSRRLASADSCAEQNKCVDFSVVPVCRSDATETDCGKCAFQVCIKYNAAKILGYTLCPPGGLSHAGYTPGYCTDDFSCQKTDEYPFPNQNWLSTQLCAVAGLGEEVMFVMKDGSGCTGGLDGANEQGFTCEVNDKGDGNGPLVCIV